MADIFAGTEPPRWLENIARPIDTEKTADVFSTILAGVTNAYRDASKANQNLPPDKQISFWERLPESFHTAAMRLRDPLYDVHMKQTQLDLGKEALSMQATQQKMNLDAIDMRDQAQDQQTWGSWIQQYNTPERRKDAPAPVLKTAAANKTYQGLLRSDTQLENEKDKDRVNQRFNAMVRGASDKTKATINRMMKESGGLITPGMYDALAADEEKTPPKLTTHEGKVVADRTSIEEFYGKDSPELKAFDANVAATSKIPVPETYTDEQTGQRFLRYGKIIRKLDDLTPQQQEALRTAREKMKKAISDGNQADIKTVQAELDNLLRDTGPAKRQKVTVIGTTRLSQ